ncbi:MAG: carboxypeptidase regulatory-like domain-containing protein [Acidobacteriota bacterium]
MVASSSRTIRERKFAITTLCNRLHALTGIAALAVCFLAFNVVLGQDSSIQGVVTDTSKAMIPGAEVHVTNVQTGITKKVLTNEVGLYLVPLLKEGQYKVTCQMAGFNTQETTIRLAIGQVAQVDFRLEVGEISNVVEVSGQTALLQSKASDVGQVIDEKRIQELPLNGRNYLELAQLSAGVVRSGQGGRGNNAGEEASFKAVGTSVSQNNVLLDGADNSASVGNGPLLTQTQAVKPAIESISEFKVITNNTSAEFGFKMGAKVLVSTKSGTNDFHGALYEFHRNASLAANNFMFNKFNNPGETGMDAPKYIRNQFGAALGGPIKRDRTFFFASFQGARVREAGTSFTRSVPSAALRAGDFSKEPGGTARSAKIFDPLTVTGSGANAKRLQFPNNQIPSARFDPIAAKMMALYPLPNVPGRENLQNNYFVQALNSDDSNSLDARVDHTISANHQVFGRYSIRRQERVLGGGMPFPADLTNTNQLDAQNLALNYAAVLSPRLTNEFRFGWTWFPTGRGDLYTGSLNKEYGITGAPVDSMGDDPFAKGLALFSPAGFSSLAGAGPLTTAQKNFSFADNLLWQKGKHSLKFGTEYRWTNLNRRQGQQLNGAIAFNGVFSSEFPNVPASRAATGNSFADFLLGWANSESVGGVAGENAVVPYWGFYANDDWKITSKLTLSLGLRWELFGAPTYPDPDSQPIGRFTFTGDINNETLDILPVQFKEWTFPKDEHDSAAKADLKNWAPRLGIAYRLSNKTIIRVGGGLYFGQNDYLVYETARYQAGGPKGAGGQTVVAQNFVNGALLLKNALPSSAPPGSPYLMAAPGATSTPPFVPEFLPTPATGQWFLDIQRQLPGEVLLDVSYNGSSSYHLAWWRVVTAPLNPDANLPANNAARQRWPAPADATKEGRVQNLTLRDNVLEANYNALLVKAEKRFSQGYTFLSSFSWSKNMDYGRDEVNSATEGQSTAGFVSNYKKDLWRNRGRSYLNRAFAYNLSVVYDLPAGPGKSHLQSGPLSWVLGGWQVGGILSMLSGPPMTQSVTPDTQNTGGGYRGDYVMPANTPGTCASGAAVGTVDCWFNPGFVKAGTPGTFGNAGRNLIDGPGWRNFDLVTSKNFAMPWKEHRLQVRFEAFNLTNTPHFGAPTLNVGSSSVGQITTADDGRIIQLAMKYIF